MPLHPAVAEYLKAHSIAHEVMDCDPELADTAEFCAAYGVPLERSANAILVASRKPPDLVALCLVLATNRLDVNGVVRQRLGARKVSFAPADLTRDRTGMEIGGVTVFGVAESVPIWVDRNVLLLDWVIVGAGTRTAKLRVDPSVFNALPGFEIVDSLVKDEIEPD